MEKPKVIKNADKLLHLQEFLDLRGILKPAERTYYNRHLKHLSTAQCTINEWEKHLKSI